MKNRFGRAVKNRLGDVVRKMQPYWWDWEWSSRRKKLLFSIVVLPMLGIVRPMAKGVDWLFDDAEDAKPSHLRDQLLRPILAFIVEGL